MEVTGVVVVVVGMVVVDAVVVVTVVGELVVVDTAACPMHAGSVSRITPMTKHRRTLFDCFMQPHVLP